MLEISKAFWSTEPLIDFICRHSKDFCVSADRVQQAPTILKHRYPIRSLIIKHGNKTVTVGPEFDVEELETGENLVRFKQLASAKY